MKVHWWSAPSAGEIVWCYFPDSLVLEPSLKPKPALIFQVFDDDALEFWVEVVYGTSQKRDPLFSGEFKIDVNDISAYQLSGLSYPTKFNFNNAAQIPFNDLWFNIPLQAPYGKNPQLGVLHPSLMNRVEVAWSATR